MANCKEIVQEWLIKVSEGMGLSKDLDSGIMLIKTVKKEIDRNIDNDCFKDDKKVLNRWRKNMDKLFETKDIEKAVEITESIMEDMETFIKTLT